MERRIQMKLTKEEKELILANRAKSKIIKTGILKQNLYHYFESEHHPHEDEWTYYTLEEQNEEIETFKNKFVLIWPAGFKFACSLDQYGTEEWREYEADNNNIVDIGNEEFESYLTNIQKI